MRPPSSPTSAAPQLPAMTLHSPKQAGRTRSQLSPKTDRSPTVPADPKRPGHIDATRALRATTITSMRADRCEQQRGHIDDGYISAIRSLRATARSHRCDPCAPVAAGNDGYIGVTRSLRPTTATSARADRYGQRRLHQCDPITAGNSAVTSVRPVRSLGATAPLRATARPHRCDRSLRATAPPHRSLRATARPHRRAPVAAGNGATTPVRTNRCGKRRGNTSTTQSLWATARQYRYDPALRATAPSTTTNKPHRTNKKRPPPKGGDHNPVDDLLSHRETLQYHRRWKA